MWENQADRDKSPVILPSGRKTELTMAGGVGKIYRETAGIGEKKSL